MGLENLELIEKQNDLTCRRGRLPWAFREVENITSGAMRYWEIGILELAAMSYFSHSLFSKNTLSEIVFTLIYKRLFFILSLSYHDPLFLPATDAEKPIKYPFWRLATSQARTER
ncbi:hypothetical protein BTUL_0120g00320 [Botrytis tulipae]|uniref:Uncharacterized protein n=1 Tax=Botrytis tulipae TaxID=87230 RepID=A0A4Z1EEY7_9HELO|nr:hypothetical protein BTUL_0120g00320 [Botrytis tulipae]